MHRLAKCRKFCCQACAAILYHRRRRLNAAISRLSHAKRDHVLAQYLDWEKRFYRVPVKTEAARIASKYPPSWTEGMSLADMQLWESVWDAG